MRTLLLNGIIGIAVLFSCAREDQEQRVQYNSESFTEVKGELRYNGVSFTGWLLSVDAVNKTKNSSHYKDGFKHGKEKKNYLSGGQAEERWYDAGIKVGVHKAWWPSGKPKFEYHFDTSGAYHGSVTEWYPSGQCYKKFHFIHGREAGRQQMWQGDGTLRANFTTVDGERYGLIGLKKCYTVNTANETIK